MSEYPQYGAGFGPQDQSHQGYLPPAYAVPYLQAPDPSRTVQGHIAPQYNGNAAAYGYNTMVPAFGAAAVTSGVPPLPIFQGWNQDPIPLPAYTAQSPAQYGYANAPHAQQYFQPAPQPNYPQKIQGDLSEGEFEDIAHAANSPRAGYGNHQFNSHDAPSYNDNSNRAVYPKAQDFGTQQPNYSAANNYQYPKRANSQLKRQQSGSYSPYVQPGGDKNDGSKDQNHQSSSSNYKQPIGVSQPSYPGSAPSSRANASQEHIGGSNGTTPSMREAGDSLPSQAGPAEVKVPAQGRSVAESRKKATAAILNLWPHGIRYDTYIQEGYPADIVGNIFDELKFSRSSSPKPTDDLNPSMSTTNGTINGQGPAVYHDTGFKGKVPAGQPISNSSSGGQDAPLQKPPASANVPSKPAVLSEKEKTLQSKMEALRKSREERAQKAAAKSGPKSPVETVKVPPAVAVTHKSAAPSSQVSIENIPVTSAQGALDLQPQVDSLPTSEKLLSISPAIPKPAESVASHTLGRPSPSSLPPRPEQTSVPRLQIHTGSTTTTPSLPMIPGLFLASAAASPAVPMSSNTTPDQVLVQRKRPVAADFDEPPKSVAPFRRPFGRFENTHEPLIIDVSEPESDDEDVAMDLDSQADQDSPLRSARRMSEQQPQSSNTPTPMRKPFTPPPNSQHTNTLPQSVPNNSTHRPDILERKYSEIQLLKNKIAEFEARKKLRGTPSGTRTPQSMSTTQNEAKDISQAAENLASKVAASLEVQNIAIRAESQQDLTQQTLENAQAIAVKEDRELKRSRAEQRRLRRQTIDADQTQLMAQIQAEEQALERLHMEAAQRKAALEAKRAEERRLAEEKALLMEEEETQKDKATENASEPQPAANAPGQSSSLVTPPEANSQTSQEASEPSIGHPSINHKSPPSEDAMNVDLERPANFNSAPLGLTNGEKHNESSPQPPLEHQMPIEELVKDIVSADQALDVALQEQIQAEADAHTRDNDRTQSEQPSRPEASQPEIVSVPTHIEEDGHSPEYSPALDRSIADDSHEDDYEPPEAHEPIEIRSPIESPPFSPAPPESIPEIEEQTNDVNSRQASETIVETRARTEELPSRNGSLPEPIEVGVEPNEFPSFVPYESPLKTFRKYRFHPEYKEHVSTGLKSLTYSHKIDPQKEFCRYELAGGICNDPTCDLQHFKDIRLPDDAVLTALGSPEEFKGEERDRFCDGLREVLMDLRVRKIRDFDVIASEIVAHRAKFLADKSKVLALGDIDI